MELLHRLAKRYNKVISIDSNEEPADGDYIQSMGAGQEEISRPVGQKSKKTVDHRVEVKAKKLTVSEEAISEH